MSLRDRMQRRWFPRLVVALSTVRGPRRLAAALRRACGGQGRVRLFVAFDDPSSAVAVLGLVPRTAGRRVELVIEPVVRRGIPGDPAKESKRRYAVADARRLARREQRELSRTAPLDPRDTAFLAAWTAAAPAGPARVDFCVAAMRRLWFESDGPVLAADFTDLYRTHAGCDPPPPGAEGHVRSERSMRARRLYDTPIAVTGGQWFFAHERLPQIEHALDDLGWTLA